MNLKRGIDRREMLKTTAAGARGLAGAAAAAGSMVPGAARAAELRGTAPPRNPYGRRPGGGISLLEYFQALPSMNKGNAYCTV